MTGLLELGAGAKLRQGSGHTLSFTTRLPRVAGGNYEVPNTYVVGSFAMDADLVLPLATNDLVIPAGRQLALGGHSLSVGGDVTLQASGSGNSHLTMTHPSDSLHVKGDFSVSAHTQLDSGVVVLLGDLAQGTVGNGIDPKNTFVFAGTDTQTVSFAHAGTSFLHHAKVTNTSGGVTLATHAYVTGLLELGAGAKLRQGSGHTLNFDASFPRIAGATYDVPNTYVNASFTMDADLVLPLATNDVVIVASRQLTLGGHSLSVGGDLTLQASGSGSPHLTMTNPSDSLHVKGAFSVSAHTQLDSGVVVLEGDLAQGTIGNAIDAKNLFVFAGSGTQTVSFAHPGTSFLHHARVVNSSGGVTMGSNATLTGDLDLLGLLTNPAGRTLTIGGTLFLRAGGTLANDGAVSAGSCNDLGGSVTGSGNDPCT